MIGAIELGRPDGGGGGERQQTSIHALADPAIDRLLHVR